MSSEPVIVRPRPVPFFDLGPSHAGLKEELLKDIGELMEVGAFTNGPQVAAFEEAFSAYCGATACVGLASGLDALRLALLAAGIKAGDEVIVPAMTFVATLEAVTQAGGRPVLVDVGESDYCLDVDATAAVVGAGTRFVLPVHLYGQMADMRAVERLASKHDLQVIEDACQAHGATRDGVRAGLSGLAGAFSFYPAKNLGAFGDAGALVTGDETIAATVRALREHGQQQKYRHALEGFTARLDTIQAIVLLHKLPLLDGWNEQRRAAAALYSTLLNGVGDLQLPSAAPGSEPVWHLYVVRTENPTRLAEHLATLGVRTGRHYPEPCHLTEAYAWLGHKQGSFPIAETLAQQALSLPLYPGISEDEVGRVAEAVEDYFRVG